jgi:hypothetical protein
MATDSDSKHENSDFDFGSFIQSPMTMITGAMAAADTMRKTMGAMVESVQSLQKSAAALESILERVDNVVSQVEGPAKVLGPELERLATRVATMSNLFDRTPVETLPELFETFTEQMNGVLAGMAEIPKRLGPLGELFGSAVGMFGGGRASARVAATPLPSPPVTLAATPTAQPPAKTSPTNKAPAKTVASAKKVAPAKKKAASQLSATKSTSKTTAKTTARTTGKRR